MSELERRLDQVTNLEPEVERLTMELSKYEQGRSNPNVTSGNNDGQSHSIHSMPTEPEYMQALERKEHPRVKFAVEPLGKGAGLDGTARSMDSRDGSTIGSEPRSEKQTIKDDVHDDDITGGKQMDEREKERDAELQEEETLQKEVQNLEKAATVLGELLRHSKVQVLNLQDQAKRSGAEREHMQLSLDIMQRYVSELEEARIELSENNGKLKDEIEDLKKEKKEVENALSIIEAKMFERDLTVDRLERSLSALQDKLKVTTMENTTLKHRLRKFGFLQEESDRLTAALNERIKELEAVVAERDQLMDCLKMTQAHLDFSAAEKELALKSCREEMERMRTRYDNTISEQDANEQQKQQLHCEMHALKEINKRLHVEVNSLNSTVAAKGKEVERLQRENQTLQGEIETYIITHNNTSWAVQNEEIQLTQQELGRGAYGVVVVAEFRGSKVAAKCLYSDIISDYNRDMFVREMNIAAKLRHPNLVQLIGATLKGRPVILTELMTTSLRATLVQGPLEPPQIKSIGQDVARALNYMHLTRPDPILHRDISSANVLLNPTPSNGWLAKLSDYGSANFLHKVKTIGPGNPAYSAPEAVTPSKQSIKMDVFSFGVMLVEMVIRKSPDQDIRAAQIHEAKMKCVDLPTLSRLAQLIDKCVDDNPARRPTIGDVLFQLN